MWSSKGGTGVSVTAAALGLYFARAGTVTTIFDLTGDQCAVLGVMENGAGLSQWVAAGPKAPADSLRHLASPIREHLGLIRQGGRIRGNAADGKRLVASCHPSSVFDCGRAEGDFAGAVIEECDQRLLVVRNCYLSIQAASRAAQLCTGVVLVSERWRTLTRGDVADVLGRHVVLEIRYDPAVGRGVDAGTMVTRFPRPLQRALDRSSMSTRPR